jgi:hypothetical protein
VAYEITLSISEVRYNFLYLETYRDEFSPGKEIKILVNDAEHQLKVDKFCRVWSADLFRILKARAGDRIYLSKKRNGVYILRKQA